MKNSCTSTIAVVEEYTKYLEQLTEEMNNEGAGNEGAIGFVSQFRVSRAE